MSVIKVCSNCQKEYSVKPYQAETRKWCSIKCKNEAHRVHKTCLHCSKDFLIFASQERKGLGQYCSKPCRDLSRTLPKKPKIVREIVLKICEECSKTFRVPPARKDTARFCCKECKYKNEGHREVISAANTGEKSSRWRGGLYKHRSGYVFQRSAVKGIRPTKFKHQMTMLTWFLEESPDHPFLMKTDGGIWFAAGIEIHHIDRDRANNTRDNLLAVTKEAHHRIHDYGKKPEPWECWPSNPAKW